MLASGRLDLSVFEHGWLVQTDVLDSLAFFLSLGFPLINIEV